MAVSSTMTGARTKFGIYDPATQKISWKGIFSSVSYAVQYNADPVYTLGNYAPVDLVYTHVSPVSGDATGFRVMNAGPYVSAGGIVPRLQDLLYAEGLTFAMVDRQTGLVYTTIYGVKVLGYRTASTIRQLQEMTFPFSGLIVNDESTENAESPGAPSYP